jgi:hypothetical protein
MNEKVLAAEAAVRDAARLLEDLAREARAAESRYLTAVEVLSQMGEALLASTMNVAGAVLAESIVAGEVGPP